MSAEYAVVHNAYCGMTIVIAQNMSWTDARARAKRRIEWFKKTIGGEVMSTGSKCWELCEPEVCMMVPDSCGVLKIVKQEDVVIQ